MKNRISIERPIHPEVLKVAKDVRKEIIAVNRISNGQCHTASTIIVQRLKEKGIKAKVCGRKFLAENKRWGTKYECHFWVKVHKVILDVTADQFNRLLRKKPKMSSIVYGTKKELNNYYSYTR